WVEADTYDELIAVASSTPTPATSPPCQLLYYAMVQVQYHDGTTFVNLDWVPMDEFWQYPGDPE
ncbi:MAG TPA: hypothetical protein VFB80_18260, partial [Pirellulaceae bacterium]|nr:hypothetical protein [Pirellulaceae bacterium]